MLSIFPEFFNYSLVGILILRLTYGLMITNYGFLKIIREQENKWKLVGAVELMCGILLVIGLFTQPASLIMALMMLGVIILKIRKIDRFRDRPYNFYIMLMIIPLSLLFLGPGLFSFDLPL